MDLNEKRTLARQLLMVGEASQTNVANKLKISRARVRQWHADFIQEQREENERQREHLERAKILVHRSADRLGCVVNPDDPRTPEGVEDLEHWTSQAVDLIGRLRRKNLSLDQANREAIARLCEASGLAEPEDLADAVTSVRVKIGDEHREAKRQRNANEIIRRRIFELLDTPGDQREDANVLQLLADRWSTVQEALKYSQTQADDYGSRWNDARDERTAAHKEVGRMEVQAHEKDLEIIRLKGRLSSRRLHVLLAATCGLVLGICGIMGYVLLHDFGGLF